MNQYIDPHDPPDLHDPLDPVTQMAVAAALRLAVMGAPGIPEHRRPLYFHLRIPLDEALAHEASAESEESLDAALATLAALTVVNSVEVDVEWPNG